MNTIRSALLLLLLLLAGCNGGGDGGTDPPPVDPPPVDGDPVIQELFKLHNAARVQDGDSPLRLEDRCLQAAKKHAQWMAETGRMSHTGRRGSSVGDRLRSEGYAWTLVGENIARGYPDPESVFRGWMNSSGHRRNILNGAYAHVGFGYADGARGRFWCAVFGRSGVIPQDYEGEKVSTPEGIEPEEDEAEEVSVNNVTMPGDAIMVVTDGSGGQAVIPASAWAQWQENFPKSKARPYDWSREAPLTEKDQ